MSDEFTKAEESEAVKNTRERLKNRFEEIDKQISHEALKQKKAEISEKIYRNASQRFVVKSKLQLFDNNENPAEASEKIIEAYNNLKQEHSRQD